MLMKMALALVLITVSKKWRLCWSLKHEDVDEEQDYQGDKHEDDSYILFGFCNDLNILTLHF